MGDKYLNREEYLSKLRVIELWDENIIDSIEVGTTKGLYEIHTYLFQDVFDHAGKVRIVNIAKGNFSFARAMFLGNTLAGIDEMADTNFDEIVEKYVEMNIAHPFREGNGRATRIWLNILLKDRLNFCIDWSEIDKYAYLSAMERSPVNDLELNTLLKSAMTEDIYNRQVYMRGLQASYSYENQNDIDKKK